MNIVIHLDTKCWFIRNSNAVNDHAICFFLKKLNKCNHWHNEAPRARSADLFLHFFCSPFRSLSTFLFIFCSFNSTNCFFKEKKRFLIRFALKMAKVQSIFATNTRKSAHKFRFIETFYKHRISRLSQIPRWMRRKQNSSFPFDHRIFL